MFATLLPAFIVCTLGGAHSQQVPVIALSAPLSGATAILGEQVRRGAEVAAARSGIRLETLDDACTAEGGAAAARRAVEQQAAAVVGFLCTESLEAALPILKDASIPVITVGVRTNAITDRRARTGWPVFRLGPRDDSEAQAVAALIPAIWRETPFAILDDGAIAHRDLAESLRLAAEEAGLKPLLVDGYRPALERQPTLVARLREVGARAAFISGDNSDLELIARELAGGGEPVAIAGGEQLATSTAMPDGTIMVGMPPWRDGASREALEALDNANVMPDGYVLPSFAAVEILAGAIGATSTSSIAERIAATDLNTAIGRVRFDDKGDLVDNPFRGFRYNGHIFEPLENE